MTDGLVRWQACPGDAGRSRRGAYPDPSKLTSCFDEVLRSEGVEVIRLPYRSRREVLDHLLIFERRHLEYVLRELVEQYKEARQHQWLDQRTPRRREPTAASETDPCGGAIDGP